MVNIIYSLTNGGAPISSVVDHGNAGNGDTTGAQVIYIRHDGGSKITDVGLYLRELSGTYGGSFTPEADLAEVLGWGDEATADAFGGFLLNMNAAGSWADGWADYATKDPSYGTVFRSGVGDSEDTAVTLVSESGSGTDGEIPAGGSPNVRIACKVQIPQSEDTVGIRQWEQVLRYSYTS